MPPCCPTSAMLLSHKLQLHSLYIHQNTVIINALLSFKEDRSKMSCGQRYNLVTLFGDCLDPLSIMAWVRQ